MRVMRWVPKKLADDLVRSAQGARVWLVGGAVRDRLLNRPEPDLDFVVERQARALARRYADSIRASYYDLDRARDTGRVVIRAADRGHTYLDFAGMRGADIQADLKHRDFTINSLGVPLGEPDQLLDPTGGVQDLRDRVLRACYPHAIQDDPVRSLRAVRIATELGFTIEPATIEQVRSGAPLLADISTERIRDEIMRMLAVDEPVGGLRILDHLGLLAPVFPDLAMLKGQPPDPHHPADDWAHALATVDSLSRLLLTLRPEHDPEAPGGLTISQVTSHIGRFRTAISADMAQEITVGRRVRQLLFLAALYHLLASDRSAQSVAPRRSAAGPAHLEGISGRARDLRLSSAEVDRLALILLAKQALEMLAAAGSPGPREVYRFLLNVGGAASQAVLLTLAAVLAQYSPASPPREAWLHLLGVARQVLAAHYGQGEVHMDLPDLVTGRDLVDSLGMQPGPEVGRMLAQIREAHALGEIRSREAALEFARERMGPVGRTAR